MAGSFSERLLPRRGVLAEVETTAFDVEPHICHLVGLCCFETLLQQEGVRYRLPGRRELGMLRDFDAGLVSGPSSTRCIGPSATVESLCWSCIEHHNAVNCEEFVGRLFWCSAEFNGASSSLRVPGYVPEAPQSTASGRAIFLRATSREVYLFE
ncbi:uncharacterized protein BDZ83DRAFT_727777 [Colletotrichum acutatum]|uniref:Uncharacterized protein n=1 Tax=Glomerella acutata TaxID=27357 RepID=A0AAD8XK14_GLOAC|nr:uncharacterized protein BDZ83DRAFT_727777 [Colletotrichum acutatum]KAK1728745.1 hypothetical protein BDZ83DRAFT_727777 [Colletotrichum acutatum]